MSLANPSSQTFNEHPWDPWNPQGMPTANGQLISAAQMFEQAGEAAPQPKLMQQQQQQAILPMRTRAQVKLASAHEKGESERDH